MIAIEKGYTFKRAVRENVSLIIGLAGGTGSGKTYSAMRLASGLSGRKPFAVIDTENGRASHYADQFAFDVCDLRAPFRPDAYAQAIQAADAAGYPVIVVDSMSHEHAGDGGLLDWQEEELQRMAGDEWKKREACKMAAWIKPKSAHKHLMQKLLQVKAHLILCFRAEEKIEMVRGENGKIEVRAKSSPVGKDGWVPICEKNVPFEATCSFLLLATAPGVPHPIKLQAQHRAIFEAGKPIEEQNGEELAQWAAGGQAQGGGRRKAASADERDDVGAPRPEPPATFALPNDRELGAPPSNPDIAILAADFRTRLNTETGVRALSEIGNEFEASDLPATQKSALRILLREKMGKAGRER